MAAYELGEKPSRGFSLQFVSAVDLDVELPNVMTGCCCRSRWRPFLCWVSKIHVRPEQRKQRNRNGKTNTPVTT